MQSNPRKPKPVWKGIDSPPRRLLYPELRESLNDALQFETGHKIGLRVTERKQGK